jgi:hypothetical protein
MKKLIMTIAIATMFVAPAMAQVFLDDEDMANRSGKNTSQLFIDNPAVYDSGDDWYTPVGEGLLVLAGLAGAYLVGKRRKEE